MFYLTDKPIDINYGEGKIHIFAQIQCPIFNAVLHGLYSVFQDKDKCVQTMCMYIIFKKAASQP